MPNTVKESAVHRAAAPPRAEPKPQTAAPSAASRPARPRLPPAGIQVSALAWQLAAACTGILLGAGQVYGGAAPFGLALVIGCAPGYLPAAALGAVVGGLAFLPLEQAVTLALGAAAALIARRLRPGRYGFAAAMGCAVLAAAQLAAGFPALPTPALAARLACTAALAAGFGLAIHTLPAGKPRGACLWLAILAACAQRLALTWFAPGLALFALAGLCAAFAASLEQSAVLAVALAAAVTAATPSLSFAALAVALGTLGAAALYPGERWRCAGVFAAGCALGALAAPDLSAAATLGTAAAAGLLLYLLVPPRMLQDLFPQPAPPASAQSLTGAARRLATIADTLSDIAATVNAVCERQAPPKGESFDFVVEYTARRVCQNCARRSLCWVKGYSCAMDGLYQFKPVLEQTGHADLEHMPGQLSVCEHPADLVGSVNHGYRLWRSRRQTRARANTLRAALTEQYGAMAAALAQLSARLGQAGLPDPRRESRVAQLFASIGLEALECSVSADVTGHITASITVARTAFAADELRALTDEMSRICRRDFALPEVAHCRTVTMLTFTERPLFDVQFGSASRPAEEVSGDACDQFCDSCGRAQMILCDGMGTGRPAAVDGQLAARLTGQLLRAGFAAESAARLVNVAMGLKNGEQESGATLDLLTVDLFTGRAGLFKAGAAPSFLVRGGDPRMMEGASLPMGILDAVVGRSTSFALDAGDLVVLVSDGVLCDGADWILQQLQLSARLGHSPAQLANTLADSAVRRAGQRRDDITVAVLRLDRR